MIYKYFISFLFLAILLIQFSAGSLITYIDFETVEDISSVVTDGEEEETKDRHGSNAHGIIIQLNTNTGDITPPSIFRERYINKVSIAPPYTPPDLA